jgi:hypothetical protein
MQENMRKKAISLKVDQLLYQAIQKSAKKNQRSISNMIVFFLSEGVNTHKAQKSKVA